MRGIIEVHFFASEQTRATISEWNSAIPGYFLWSLWHDRSKERQWEEQFNDSWNSRAAAPCTTWITDSLTLTKTTFRSHLEICADVKCRRGKKKQNNSNLLHARFQSHIECQRAIRSLTCAFRRKNTIWHFLRIWVSGAILWIGRQIHFISQTVG